MTGKPSKKALAKRAERKEKEKRSRALSNATAIPKTLVSVKPSAAAQDTKTEE